MDFSIGVKLKNKHLFYKHICQMFMINISMPIAYICHWPLPFFKKSNTCSSTKLQFLMCPKLLCQIWYYQVKVNLSLICIHGFDKVTLATCKTVLMMKKSNFCSFAAFSQFLALNLIYTVIQFASLIQGAFQNFKVIFINFQKILDTKTF